MQGFLYRILMVRYVLLLIIVLPGINAKAQYFGGRNKPGYKIINYKVYNTPHYEIYHYAQSDSLINSFAQLSEKWYKRHQMIFKDTFPERNPIIVYNNHADFQQTNAISGLISVGTGGVTEALKNRVVMPFMESAAQTDHVLGHEMVHAFQYKIILGEDSLQQRNLRNIPLWMVEGMAEYLSVGSYDPQTAMWMRDAVINNDFPTLEALTNSYKYFPYRYGHAFWAYTTGLMGDTIVKPLFDLTTKIGYDKAMDSLLHINERVFSRMWKTATKEYYFSFLKDTVENPVGKKLIYDKNGGEVNIAPSLSPDGKYLMYMSERDLFTFDLYMADAFTGKILKKISHSIRDNQIDDFNYLESGGAWSPDSRYFAFVIFSEGINKLLIIDVNKPKKAKEVRIPNLDAFSNPTWSNDGNTIVVTGLENGVTDLYAYDVQKNSTRKVTNDIYCNLQPSFSKDGKYLLCATDRPAIGQHDSVKSGYNIARVNVINGETEVFPVFLGADNLNPQFSPDDQSVYFLSDADGFRNLYRYVIDSAKVYRLTNIITGISGVTPFSPAFTVDKKIGIVVYTHYYASNYSLYQAFENTFDQVPVPLDSINKAPGMLPPAKRISINIVDYNLHGYPEASPMPVDSFKQVPFKHKFKLDYIGSSGVGVAVSSYYGTGMAGSVDMLFSDIVGDYQVYTGLRINGEVYDFAGSVAFINTKRKIDWGVSYSHIPYLYAQYYTGKTKVFISEKDENKKEVGKFWDAQYYNLDYTRIFEDAINIFGIYPLSQTKRLEASMSSSFYYYRLDRISRYYTRYNRRINDSTFVAATDVSESYSRNMPVDPGLNIQQVGMAYTLDNAFMGIASPLRGERLRVEGEYYFGDMNFYSFLFDFRRYIYFKPFCLATRFYHAGRYGLGTSNMVIQSMYIGYPWLVRGYGDNYIYGDDENINERYQQLFGSRIAVANIELRLPFTGPERLCIIPFKYLFTELSGFIDGGIAWDKDHTPTLRFDADLSKYRYPLFSYGVSLRFNIFGFMVLEPYYAVPIQKNGKKYAGFELNFFPGW